MATGGPGPDTRNIPLYETLGHLVSQEIPYDIEPGSMRFLNLDDEEQFATGIGRVDRFGLLNKNARRLPVGSSTPAGEGPSPLAGSDVTKALEDLCYHVDLIGTVSTADSPGPTIGHPGDEGRPLRITKVIRIPYRYRRKDNGEERQNYILICYSGPDSN